MRHSLHDVIVVGGGPAGATAAHYLARHGMAVALLDRHPFPHAKACGGGLTYRLLHRFPELAEELSPHILKRVDTLHFHAPDGASFRYTYEEPLSLMVRRQNFDALLIERCQRAGVTVMAPCAVHTVVPSEKHIDVIPTHGETLRAAAVIGADGVNSIVARASGLRDKWPRVRLMSTVVAECPVRAHELPDPDTMSIFFGFHGVGYGWVFPKGNLVNIGIGALLSENERTHMKAVFDDFIRALTTRGILAPTFEPANVRGGLIPVGGILPKTQTNRVLLCGDAAGFVNAVTGEGIYHAMVSGDLAAKTLLKAWQAGDMSAKSLGEYQLAWHRELGAEIGDSTRILNRLSSNPHMMNEIVRMVAGNTDMQRIFTDYFMGKLDHAELKRALKTRFLPQYLKYQAAKLLQRLPFPGWRTRFGA